MPPVSHRTRCEIDVECGLERNPAENRKGLAGTHRKTERMRGERNITNVCNLDERLNKTKKDRGAETSDKIGISGKIGISRIKIRESIVVEGRDDSAAVLSAVDADIIITNGFRLRRPVVERMARALASNGLIILTDPDFAGENIRRRIEKTLGARADAINFVHLIKHARLVAEDALKDGDIGIENASPEAIRDALLAAGVEVEAETDAEIRFGVVSGEFAMPGGFAMSGAESGEEKLDCRSELNLMDMMALGLAGEGSRERRTKIGRELGIGYANAGQFLERLRRRNIRYDILKRLLEKMNEQQ